jgi:hypothetical protein
VGAETADVDGHGAEDVLQVGFGAVALLQSS